MEPLRIYILLLNGYSVESDERGRYLKALNKADAGDLSLLTEIWIERLSKAFKKKREK